MNFNSKERSTFLRCAGFFRTCGGWHTWLAVGVGSASLLGGVISGVSSASSANAANKTNIANTNATNALNYQMFQQSRGANGNAILPLYMGGDETQAGTDAYNAYQNMLGMSNAITPQLMAANTGMAPSFAGAANTISGLYNGQNLQKQLGYTLPYAAANLQQAQTVGQGGINVAGANVNAVNTGLAQTMARLNANNQANGFFGNSTFANNRLLDASMAAQQQAGVGMAQAQANYNTGVGAANLGNIQNIMGLQMSNLANQTNTSPISSYLQSYNNSLSLPTQSLAQNLQAAQSPLNFFRLPVQSFQTQNMPYQAPAVNTGQILGGAVSQGANTYGLYSMMQNMQQPQPTNYNPGYGYGTPSYGLAANPYSYTYPTTPTYADNLYTNVPNPYANGAVSGMNPNAGAYAYSSYGPAGF